MVAVTAILLTLLGVAILQFRPEYAGQSPRQVAEAIRRTGAGCRRQSTATGEISELFFDPERKTITSSTERFRLPKEMRILLNGGEIREKTPILCFFPDGSAAEAELELELESDGDRVKLRVSPLTGMMEIDENNAK